MAHTPGTFLEYLEIAVRNTNAQIDALETEQKADSSVEFDLLQLREGITSLMTQIKNRSRERDGRITALREELEVMEEIRRHIAGEPTG